MFFSANCEDDAKNIVLDTLGIASEALGEQYLGLPMALGRSTIECFEYIPKRVRKHVTGWG